MPAPEESRAKWRKSSYSNGSGGSCVEIAVLPATAAGSAGSGIAVRDSKDPHGPALTFTTRQWSAFTAAIKSREFDLT
jgi:hypothetical protein